LDIYCLTTYEYSDYLMVLFYSFSPWRISNIFCANARNSIFIWFNSDGILLNIIKIWTTWNLVKYVHESTWKMKVQVQVQLDRKIVGNDLQY
jgi:hypothetical protein